ncbi:MAG: helix-turn-helix domain-containing protein [Magnetococcales bacterium]|nr:helix-turn-helix domain-containing protein [Magnetococcales bacterium]
MDAKATDLMGSQGERPDPEVSEKARRRTFSASYKVRILEKVDQCTHPGEIGSLLRREGLHSSHLTKWRRQREEGVLAGLSPRQRGPRKEPVNPLAQQVAAQEREIQRLRQKLEKAETIIEFQKKISELLGIALNPEENGKKN